MAWLVRDGEVLAAVEFAATARARRRGLMHRDEFEGALVLRPCRNVHTAGMRFPIDVAFCDADLYVLDIVALRPHRMTLPRWRARAVIEAEAGAFDRWRVRVGDQVEVRS